MIAAWRPQMLITKRLEMYFGGYLKIIIATSPVNIFPRIIDSETKSISWIKTKVS
ncbi:MAG TPA: hypothetical protein VF354_04855 [Candidatus Methanoperedens sp.]